MDVLYNTIDVRDLLSSSDSPNSPISAPDLRLLISRLDSHSLRIKSTVQSYLLSHQADFASLFSQCSDVVSKTENLSSQVIALLNLISDQPIESHVGKIIGEIVEKRRELVEKREILELLRVVSELDRKFGVVRKNVESGRVVEAAEGLRELKLLLGVSSNDVVEGEPLVYGILRKHWTDSFEEIQDLLLRFVEAAVRFEPEGNTVHIKSQASVNGFDGLELYTILKAMDAADILDYGFAKVADLIIKHIITPVVSARATPSVIEETEHDFDRVPEAVLKMVPFNPESQRTKVDGEAMYSNIVQILKFINKFLCFQNGSWMRCFGRLTWPRMSDQIILNFLSKVVPDDPSNLGEFQEIMKLTTGFETALKVLLFISPSDVRDEKLSKFTNNIEVHFASRKKVQILAKARKMLLQSNFSLSQVSLQLKSFLLFILSPHAASLFSYQDYITRLSGLNKEETSGDFSNHVELPFSSEKCVVSEAAIELMDLVLQILENVCLLPPKVGLEFYQTARNALVLYEAIVPVKLERQLDSINQAAVLIHNDCLYLSQEILGLAFEGGLSEGYKNHIAEKELPDNTYAEDGLALFRVQGSGPDNMQATGHLKRHDLIKHFCGQ